jgi:tRNA threonylcarbamoyladenosine biosynthesis protein TsaE
VQVYRSKEGMLLYHIDCYRMETAQDFLNAGFDEYVHEPQGKSFIEWPEIIMSLLPEHTCHVHLSYHGEGQREARIVIP